MVKSRRRTLWKRLAWPARTRLIGASLSLALGVAALFGVGNMLSAVELSLYRQARDLLGADLQLTSWRPLDDSWSIKARSDLADEGEVAQVIELASMARHLRVSAQETPAAQEATLPFLVSLKAVESKYPLRGILRLSASLNEGAESVDLPSPSLSSRGVWISALAAKQREIKRGDHLEIGGLIFEVEGLIEREPDGGISGALSFAPRVIMRVEDLRRTPLIKQGSRVRHKLLFAIDSGQPHPDRRMTALKDELQVGIPEHISVQTYLNAQPNTLQIFERVALFFSMIGLVTLSLSFLTFLSALWSLLHDHLPLIATLRAIGVSSDEVRSFYGRLCIGLGLLGGALGVLLGVGFHWSLSIIVGPWVGIEIPTQIDLAQAGGAVLAGLVLSVSVNQFLQRGLGRLDAQALWRDPSPSLQLKRSERALFLIFTLLILSLYLSWLSGSGWLSGLFIATLSLLTFGCMCLIWVGFKLYALWRHQLKARPNQGLYFVLTHLLGTRRRVSVSLLSLGLGFSLIVALLTVQASLKSALILQDDEAPHIFLIDVQEDQRVLVDRISTSVGAPKFELTSISRARLSHLNQRPILRENLDRSTPAGRLRTRSLTREYSLTSRSVLGESEVITEGRWWTSKEASDPDCEYVSLEYRFAQRLGLSVGDTLTFDLQGRPLSAKVLNLRRVDWLSFNPNFLIILPPERLAGAPRTWIGATRLTDDDQLGLLSKSLFNEASNVSVIDVRAILKEGQRLLGSLSQGLTVTGGLCALAGVLLLVNVIRREQMSRIKVVEGLYMIGISRSLGWRWMELELWLMGGLCGAVVCVCAALLAVAGVRALQLPLTLTFTSFWFWVVASVIIPPIVGRLTRTNIRTSP